MHWGEVRCEGQLSVVRRNMRQDFNICAVKGGDDEAPLCVKALNNIGTLAAVRRTHVVNCPFDEGPVM